MSEPTGIQVLFDSLDESTFPGLLATPYEQVLENARQQCPPGRRVMTAADYMKHWLGAVEQVRCSAPMLASSASPTPQTQNPFDLPVLLDTHLMDWRIENFQYTAVPVVGGQPQQRIVIPPYGKIYAISEFGLPTSTGGEKKLASEAFVHTWWAFASDRIRDVQMEVNPNFRMIIIGNGGTMGCFYELLKAYYSLTDRGGYYRVLTVPA